MPPTVDHPPHYGGGENPRETIRIIEDLGHGWGFCIGNALKYVMRAGRKSEDPTDDLKKAMWYLRRALAVFRAGKNETSPLDYLLSDEVVPDPDRGSRVILLVNLEGPPTLLSEPVVTPFLEALDLVAAGCPPVWRQPGPVPRFPRFWKGEIDFGSTIPLRVHLTPFSVPVLLLQEIRREVE